MPDRLFHGEIGPLSLAGVLQLIEGEGLTGRLGLPQGSVDFALGRPVGASCGGRAGTTAFLELFLEGGGGFQFDRTTASGESLGSLLGLIMEGCRLADEWAQIRGLVLVSRDDPSAEGASAEVLAVLDGGLTVEAATRKVGVSPVLVVDPIRVWLENGALHEVTTPPPVRIGSVPPSEGYSRAMEEGRSRLRSGDFDGAESSFELALILRPEDVIARQNLRRVRQVRTGSHQGYAQWSRRR